MNPLFATASKYTAFAILAITLNMIVQMTIFHLYNGFLELYAGLACGTVAGMLVKFILDKKYIFKYRAPDTGKNVITFIMYCLMGLITTCIFWGMEIMFDYMFNNDSGRLLGGLIGLILGYTAKYFLDRRFVFVNRK
jgi:putative flippase GtrA